MNGQGYAAVPSWMIADQSISGPALLVYAALASRSGFESIHPGQDILAAEARCGERRARDAIKELEALGVIERVTRRHRGGARASDGYVLLSGRRPSAVAEQPAPAAGSGGDLPADSDRTNRQNRASIPSIDITTKDITTNAHASARDGVISFKEWWAEYPRKVSRGSAVKPFEKAVEKIAADGRDPREVLMRGVRQLAEWVRVTRPETRLIPHASTWLNGERWDDPAEHMSGPAVSGGLSPTERMLSELHAPAVGPDSLDWGHHAIGR